jgi:hypothetical protein
MMALEEGLILRMRRQASRGGDLLEDLICREADVGCAAGAACAIGT